MRVCVCARPGPAYVCLCVRVYVCACVSVRSFKLNDCSLRDLALDFVLSVKEDMSESILTHEIEAICFAID